MHASTFAFTYRALRADGTELIGEVAAASRTAARDQLAASGLFPTEVRATARPMSRGATLPTADLALGLRLLASLLASGLPLERALGVFPHVAPAGWGRERLSLVREAVREGASLAAAIRVAGYSLPPHALGMLDAGDASGALVESLRAIAALSERSAEHRAAVRGALAYPAILAVAGSVATGLLVGVVLPRFADLLADAGQELPAAARILVAISEAVARWWLPLLLIVVVTLVWCSRALATDPTLRRRMHERLLDLPLIGPLRHAIAGSRLASTLAEMLGAGVPIAAALNHAAGAAGDAAITTRTLVAREGVIRGERLSSAFATSGVVRPVVVQLIRAGEASGELAEMLRTGGAIEGEWSLARLRLLTRLIEPALILGFGAAIAFVASALLQAVYSLRPLP